MKKIIFIPMALWAAVLFAQSPNIVYDLDKGTCSPYLPEPMSPNTPVDIKWVGNSAEWYLDINGISMPAASFPGNKVTIGADSRIVGYQNSAVFNRPLSISMKKGNMALEKVNVSGSNPPPSPSRERTTEEKKIIFTQTKAIARTNPLWKDAEDLSSAIDQGSKDMAVAILNKYYPNKNYDQIIKAISDDGNIFLTEVLPSISINDSDNSKQGNKINSNAGNIGAAILPQSVVLDAIGSFISKRLAEELNRAYLDRFRDKIKGSQDLKDILPLTSAQLTKVGEDNTIDYRSILPGLRKNLFEDLSDLPLNSQQLLKHHRKDFKGQDTLELYVAALAMLETTNALYANATMEEVLHRLGKYDYESGTNDCNVQTILRVLSMISDHLRVYDSNGPWIDASQTINSNQSLYIFAGLMYKKDSALLKDNKIKNAAGQWVSLYDEIKKDDAKALIDLIYQIIGLIHDIDQLKQTNKNSDNQDRFLALTEKALTLVSGCVRESDNNVFNKAVGFVQTIIKIKTDIKDKNVVSAGTRAIGLIEQILPDRNGLPGFKKEFFRYLNFAQSVIDAKDKEELVKALENAAAPVGSFRLKRQSPFTASITSYPGLFAGHETYKEGLSEDKRINTYGFTAPLGLAFSVSGQDSGLGTRDQDKDDADPKASLTFYFPLIDVGAITAFRLADQQSELPDITWNDFISPGFFLNYGFKKSLLTIHAGAQIGPELQQVGQDKKPRLWRFGIGISADLHLWNIYTKP